MMVRLLFVINHKSRKHLNNLRNLLFSWLNATKPSGYSGRVLKLIHIFYNYYYYVFDLNSTSTENTNKATMKGKKTITETTTLRNIKSKQKRQISEK